MLSRLENPKILSKACHEFSARLDINAFDPGRTPIELGVKIPESLRSAVLPRQAQFVAGRFAAARALKAAGCSPPIEIGVNSNRSPLWPEGFIGSITHTSDYVSAVVANRARLGALGRDTEQRFDDRVAQEIQTTTLVADEIQRQPASGFSLSEYVGLLFSGKESLFKALSPLVDLSFDFLDAEAIEISRDQCSPQQGHIRFRLIKDLGSIFRSGFELDARFKITEQIHTAVEVSLVNLCNYRATS